MGSAKQGACLFSVVIPLEFHRGQAETCLRAWLEGQTFPRERFEVIVACPRDFPEDEAKELRGWLSGQDRFLMLPGEHDMALCEAAAREARGEVLFFTESHVYPEPEVLEVAARALEEHPEWAGFSCRSVPITHNLLSELEAELYDKDIRTAMEDHPWRKVLDQCFVIRRQAYFEAGGFESQYGHFAEWLLAARLYQLGHGVGYVPEARLHHYYIGQLREWIDFTNDFVAGEMRYLEHAEKSPGAELTLFEEVPEWAARQQYRRGVAWRMMRMLGKALAGGEQPSDPANAETRREITRGEKLAALRRWGAVAVLGAWKLILPSWLGWVRGQLELYRCLRRGDREGARRAYERNWNKLVSLRRGLYLRNWAGRAGGGADMAPKPAGIRHPGEVTAPVGAGFHLGELAGGETLRWSEPVAYVELPMKEGRYVVTLRWMPLARTPQVLFYFDEWPIPATNLKWGWEGVEISLHFPTPGVHRLGWICPPAEAPGDGRSLGLAVRAISWRREEQAPVAPTAAPLFFLHLRKTAGVAVRDALLNRFPASDPPYFLAQPGDDRDPNGHPLVTGHLHYGYIEKMRQRPVIFTVLRDPLDRALSAYDFFRSHDEAKFEELKGFVPAAEYAQRVEFFTKARQYSLGEFLERETELARFQLGNLQTRQLLRERVTGELEESHLAEALRNLEDCEVVGVLERLPETIALLEHRMGWEGVGPVARLNVTAARLPVREVDPAAREVLLSWNRLDERLYQRARELMDERLAAMRSEAPGAEGAPLPSAMAFTPAQPIHGYGWYPREQANGRWICWMGATPEAWLWLAVESVRDSWLMCEFPHAISGRAWEELQIEVNGLPVAHRSRPGASGVVIEGRVPAGHLERAAGRVRIAFRCEEARRPCDLDAGSGDERRLSLALGSVGLVAEG